MKYLRPFNEVLTDAVVKELFQPYINWDIFHKIEYIKTTYEDKGFKSIQKINCHGPEGPCNIYSISSSNPPGRWHTSMPLVALQELYFPIHSVSYDLLLSTEDADYTDGQIKQMEQKIVTEMSQVLPGYEVTNDIDHFRQIRIRLYDKIKDPTD